MAKRKAAKAVDSVISDAVEAAVAALAADDSQRRHCANFPAFVFAQHLKAVWDSGALGQDCFGVAVGLFWQRCTDEGQPIGDEYGDPLPLGEFRAAVLDVWPKVRHAAGRSFAAAFPLARKMKPRPEAAHIADPALIILVNVCCILQVWAGKSPFFLSGINAAKVFGHDAGGNTEARFGRRKLRFLCARGILREAAVGHTGLATEYFFIFGGKA